MTARRPGWRASAAVVAFLVAVVALLDAPSYASAYNLDTGVTVLALIVLAQGWNLIGGYGGQFALGQAVFVGIGAYTTAVLMTKTGVPLGLAIAASGAVSAAFGALASVALFRLRGVYFAIGSLAVALAMEAWVSNWDWVGSSRGLSLPIDRLPTPELTFRLAVVAGALSLVGCFVLARSPLGLRLRAVRDDEDAAGALGVAGTTVKRIAFVLSAFMTGVAGSLIALQQVSIDPTSMFGLSWTIDMVIMAIVGGLATVWGPALGVLLVYFAIRQPLQGAENVSLIVTGSLLVAVIRFAPEGVVGVLSRGLSWAVARLNAARAERPAAAGS
jgi:branched-chain amino acid transport system permease protein